MLVLVVAILTFFALAPPSLALVRAHEHVARVSSRRELEQGAVVVAVVLSKATPARCTLAVPAAFRCYPASHVHLRSVLLRGLSSWAAYRQRLRYAACLQLQLAGSV